MKWSHQPNQEVFAWPKPKDLARCGADLIERKEYSIDYRDGQAHRRIEDLDTTSKHAAEGELAERIGDARRGESKTRRSGNFERIADEYFDTGAKRKETRDFRDKYALLHLRGYLGPIPLANIRHRNLEHHLGRRSGQGAAAGTIIKEWNLFNSIWNWAALHDIVCRKTTTVIKRYAYPQRIPARRPERKGKIETKKK